MNRLWTLYFPGLLLLTSCQGEPPAEAAHTGGEGDENVIIQERERGPVKVILRVEPREPTFADRVHFTIEAVARRGAEVTMPSPGENLGGFVIKDYDSPPPKITADATTTRQSYVLEFLTSGEYTIPAMTISFRDRRETQNTVEEKEGEESLELDVPGNSTADPSHPDPPEVGPPPEREFDIVTDEITVHVKSMADPESLKEIAPIAPPARPPPLPAEVTWPLTIVGGLLLVGLTVFLLVKLARRPPRPPPPVPAHERAYRELEWLLGQGFIDRGDLKEFFFHLSRILREYIENRFGLRAPESTTEEFLEELSRRGGGLSAQRDEEEISREHQRLLADFLERADLVKFARYQPVREEIEGSFDAAKRFIEESRQGGETVRT